MLTFPALSSPGDAVFRSGRQRGATGEARGRSVPALSPPCPLAYLDGGRGDLDVVQPAQGAVPVDEVGGCQLVQGLQRHRRAVGAGVAPFRPLAQLPFVHKNCE